MREIIDISLPIFSGMPVYPGTAETKILQAKSGSGTSVLSQISMTSHAGTHIDAPSHVLPGGKNIDEIPLDTFYGKCRVLDLNDCIISIKADNLLPHKIQKNERILFKTRNSQRGFDKFYDDNVYLDGEAAKMLSEIGVKLVGIDALSVKQRGAPDNTSHTTLLTENIPIIEGLNLAKVEAGSYFISVLPLAFSGIDGSPARAVLVKS